MWRTFHAEKNTKLEHHLSTNSLYTDRLREKVGLPPENDNLPGQTWSSDEEGEGEEDDVHEYHNDGVPDSLKEGAAPDSSSPAGALAVLSVKISGEAVEEALTRISHMNCGIEATGPREEEREACNARGEDVLRGTVWSERGERHAQEDQSTEAKNLQLATARHAFTLHQATEAKSLKEHKELEHEVHISRTRANASIAAAQRAVTGTAYSIRARVQSVDEEATDWQG